MGCCNCSSARRTCCHVYARLTGLNEHNRLEELWECNAENSNQQHQSLVHGYKFATARIILDTGHISSFAASHEVEQKMSQQETEVSYKPQRSD